MATADIWKQRILDKLLRNTDFTAPTSLFIAFHTANPGKTGASEVTGGSYARQAITFAAATSAGIKGPPVDLEIPNMPATTVTHYSIHTAATGATMIHSDALSAPVAVLATQPFRIKASLLGIDIP